ncbi:MAG: DUF805 domain-containing protein [Rickettsiales bacterium]|jgi:uncharacterized membrane protein YhaH (DUF805 family)|nr:DUF805 domain-containing protein [Rickettsiales bacterium]
MSDKFSNTIGECFFSYWENYIGWGRATRSEYWFSVLFYSFIPHLFIDATISAFVWTFITIIPSFCVSARRLHDINKSAWNTLWGFISILALTYSIFLFFSNYFFGKKAGYIVFYILVALGGMIYSIYLHCKKGDSGSNRFGEPRI